MTIDINDLAARLAALEATVAALTTKAPKAATTSAPRKATAEQVVALPAENCFSATSREGKLFAILGGGRDVTRGEIVEAIKAHPELTRISPTVYAYDFVTALNKKLAAKAPTPAVVAAPAPIIEMVVTPTEPVVNETPAPVLDITPTAAPAAAPAAPKARTGRKAQGK